MKTNGTEQSGVGRWIAIGAVLGLLGVNGFLFWRVNTLENQIAKIDKSSQVEIAELRETGPKRRRRGAAGCRCGSKARREAGEGTQ
jgi:hypothetical protein